MTKNIILGKVFIKHFKARIEGHQNLESKFRERVALFLEDRQNPTLKDHKLSGRLNKHRSFSITGDYRVVYLEEEREILFLFVDIGTHNQVYK